MSNIHQTAVIDKNAKIHESVKVGPYCVIGPGVSIGKDCILNCLLYTSPSPRDTG